jgi:hypothetical protein
MKARFTIDDIEKVIKEGKVNITNLFNVGFSLDELKIFFTIEQIKALGKVLPLSWHKKIGTELIDVIKMGYTENERYGYTEKERKENGY